MLLLSQLSSYRRKDREKSKTKKPEAFSRAQIPRPLLHLLSLRIRRCARGSVRGRKEEVHMREANEEEEGPERGTDRSVRERNPRLPWLPSHSRLASLPWRRLVDLSLSPSLTLCLSSSSSQILRPFPPNHSSIPCRSHTRDLLYRLSHSLSPGFSPSRRANSPSFSLPLAFAHILSVPSNEEEERARDKEERDRERKEGSGGVRGRMRDTPVFHDEPGRLSFGIVRLVIG